MFEEIDKEKQELPALKTVTNQLVGKRALNFYQIVALFVMIVGLIGGIFLGNLFPACKQASGLFGTCAQTEFNFFLTITSWVATFLLAILIYALGHIIAILESIDQKMK